MTVSLSLSHKLWTSGVRCPIVRGRDTYVFAEKGGPVMHIASTIRRSVVAIGISLSLAAPQLHAAPVGGAIGRAVAEQLGLLVSQVPENMPIGTTILMTIVDASRLVAQGLTNVKANDQVNVTLLEGGKLSIVPVMKSATTQTTISSTTSIKSATISPTTTTLATKQSLLLTVDSKGTIVTKQLVPLDADLKLSAPILRR